MNLEIERKFLVNNTSFITESFDQKIVKQGFLNSHKNRVVRVRVSNEQGFLTIKGRSNESGTSRLEFEKEISLEDANLLLKLCEKEVLEKIRYLVKSGKHTFEVDVFSGENEGLVVAEIELTEEDENFTKPSWLGKEVTGNVLYYNSELSKNPYKNWKT
jgi:CYTH domain-containing protein